MDLKRTQIKQLQQRATELAAEAEERENKYRKLQGTKGEQSLVLNSSHEAIPGQGGRSSADFQQITQVRKNKLAEESTFKMVITLEELRAAINIEELEQEIADKPKRGKFSQPVLTPACHAWHLSPKPPAHDIRVRVAKEYRIRERQLLK